MVGDAVKDLSEVRVRLREARELAIGSVHHVPGDHEGKAGDRKPNVRVAEVRKGRKNAKQHARNGYGIGREAHPGKKWHEPACQRMDEVEVGNLLDLRRSPDRHRARHRRPLGLLLRHLGAVLPGCLVAALVAGGGLVAGAAVAQHPTTSREPIVIHSVFSNIDDETDTADFTDIIVSQGDTRLTAERARAKGVGFTDSQWTFAGRVVITLEPRGSLWADQAILEFRDGELTQVTAIGSAAHFEQRRTDSRGATGAQRRESREAPAARRGAWHGYADEITYYAKQDIVRLSGHAELFDGHGMQISAPMFIYHVGDDRLQGDSQSERRPSGDRAASEGIPSGGDRGNPQRGRVVHLTITP